MIPYSTVKAQLINYEIFSGNGRRRLGTSEIELPSLEFKPVDLEGAGIAGTLAMPTIGFTNSLEIGFTWRTLDEDTTEFVAQKASDFLCYGAAELYDHATGTLKNRQIKIGVRGLPKQTELGKMAAASTMDSKTTLEIVTLKIDVDKENIVELDKINYIFKVNGTDYLQQVRNVLNI